MRFPAPEIYKVDKFYVNVNKLTVPVATAKAGKFHIYSVSTVDEAIKLLTGVTTGELDEDGLYPEGSINSRVQLRLHELAQNCAMNLVTQTRTLMIKAK